MATLSTCYDSHAVVETGAIPCNPQAEVSPCCPYTDICYSNGLCAPGPGLPNEGNTQYYTGYCTDPTWSNSTACPSICNNQPGGDVSLDGVTLCGGRSYCCFNFVGCCNNSSLLFSLAVITSSTILPNPSISGAVTTSSYYPSTDATTTTPSSLVFSTPPLPTFLSATSPSNSYSASLSSSHPSTNHFAAGVGAGIGVAAALLSLIGIVFHIRRRRTRNRAPQPHENPARRKNRDITNVRTLPRIHEIDGQKPILVEPDGQHIVEIDDTRGNTSF